MAELSFELEPGEELIVFTHASFRGAAAASMRSTFALGSARMRMSAYEAWRSGVEAAGFPTAGPEMMLGLTPERIVVTRTTFWGGRPSSFVGGVPLSTIAQIAAVRHGLVTSLAFAFNSGAIAEVEAMRGRRLRKFAEIANTIRGGRTN